jgi:transketolase N-terminal domain/subunit
MNASYELWDTGRGNLIRSFSTVEAALALVDSAVKRHGRRYVADWALVEAGSDGSLVAVATGVALVDRAKQTVVA